MISFIEPVNKIFGFTNSYQESYGIPTVIFNRFHIGKELGCGAQGIVRLIIDRRTCRKFAMKQVTKYGSAGSLGSFSDEQINREVTIMKKLNHPNLIRCYEVIMTPNAVLMVRPLKIHKI